MIFLQCEAAVRHAVVQRASTHLTPGGWLVIEGFARQRSSAAVIGPKDPDLLYDLDAVADSCNGLNIVMASVDEIALNEGARHQGHASVVRFIARAAEPLARSKANAD